MGDLPQPGDPLITGLGEVVEPDEVANSEFSHITPTENVERRAITSVVTFDPVRKLDSSTAPTDDMDEQKAIAAVLGLRLMGFELTDISDLLDVPTTTVEDLLKSKATQISFERILQNLVSHKATVVQGRISSYAMKAAETVFDLMEDKQIRPDVRLKAAQDIQDRSGLNAEQFFGKNDQTTGEDELTIVYEDEDTPTKQVKVNLKRKS